MSLPPRHSEYDVRRAAERTERSAGQNAPEDSRRAAVALRYRSGDDAPRVVAKGYGVLAETIIRTARDHSLYIHESPELVNLLMQVDLDARIPPQLYAAVAELLAWLYYVESEQGSAAAKHPGLAAASQARATDDTPPV